ncbi:MAG: DUF899 family protein [Alphaproteobacteria bacterium]|nr:DUF899 family protein [Alphaproteobacteria bacterium]
MRDHEVVSRDAWIAARTKLLAQEKALTRERDALSAPHRALPWVRVEKPCTFDGADGRQTLPQIFQGRSRLVVCHFMFDPTWETGCKSCSFWAACHFLDLVPKGRDETRLERNMAWVRLHDMPAPDRISTGG